MEEMKVINEIRKAASVLKDSKLKRMEKAAPALEKISAALKLDSTEEAMILVAVLDRKCSELTSTISDLSDYLGCSVLDVMSFRPAIKSLTDKNILCVTNSREIRLGSMSFSISPDVFDAIIEGRDIDFASTAVDVQFDRFDLCEIVDGLLTSRQKGEIRTADIFSDVARIENAHPDMDFIREVMELLPDLKDRTLFYEICKDYNPSEDESTNIDATMEQIYERIPDRAAVKRTLLNGTHPVLTAGLADVENNSHLPLSDKGISLYYKELATTMMPDDTCEDRFAFVAKIADEVSEGTYGPSMSEANKLYSAVKRIESHNSGLTAIANLKKLVSEVVDRLTFYLVCYESIEYDNFGLRDLYKFMPKSMEIKERERFKKNTHCLQKSGLVTLKEGSYFESSYLEWTDKGKELFLEADAALFEEKVSDKNIVPADKISQRKLFFEPALQRQISDLEACLQENKYSSICERMRRKGQPTGIAVLLYGAPGTGKTESVMQIARSTGRAIMHVDISETKTCWFGESEKLIKEVFTNYRKLCDSSKLRPILLFNEADAVFSKRKDSNASNVAQTENAIQNIILEEMERLDGILIATTNMADNLDPAFERRFLFKIRFGKTTEQARASIWMDKIPTLSESDALKLASAYDFSGGEIDNVARKAAMEEILNGTAPTVDTLTEICSTERISAGPTRKIGFNAA